MNPIPLLLHELDQLIAIGPVERHETSLQQVTDLFIAFGDRLTGEQTEIFDAVIGRLIHIVGTGARMALALRLSRLKGAPAGVVRALAQDHISVARPLLLRSPCLQDEDLVAIAAAKGSAHSQAIAQRPFVSEPLAEVLVASRDPAVLLALAKNPGARLSRASAAELDSQARQNPDLGRLPTARPQGEAGSRRVPAALAEYDPSLQGLLTSSPRSGDVQGPPVLHPPEAQVPASTPRLPRGGGGSCLAATLLMDRSGSLRRPSAPEAGWGSSHRAGARTYRDALDTVGAIALMRPLDEEDVAGFAKRESLEEVVCAIAFCATLSVATVERLFTSGDSDLILILGRAKGWSWTTVEAVLRLRAVGPVPAQQEARLAAAYHDIEPRSAERVLRVLRRRDHREAA